MFVNSDFSDLLRIMGLSTKHEVKLPKFSPLQGQATSEVFKNMMKSAKLPFILQFNRQSFFFYVVCKRRYRPVRGAFRFNQARKTMTPYSFLSLGGPRVSIRA